MTERESLGRESLLDAVSELRDWLAPTHHHGLLNPADPECSPPLRCARCSFDALLNELGREFNRQEALQGLPADLVAVLRDPAFILQRDHEIRLADGRTLHEHLEEWRNAPSGTMSA